MDASNNFEIAFRKLTQEMGVDSKSLDDKKTEKKRLEDEAATLREEIKKQKAAIISHEEKIRQNEDKARRLKPEIDKIEMKQKKDHLQLTEAQRANAERLKEHGVKLPPQHSL